MFVLVAAEDSVVYKENTVGCMRVVEFGFTTNFDIWIMIDNKNV